MAEIDGRVPVAPEAWAFSHSPIYAIIIVEKRGFVNRVYYCKKSYVWKQAEDWIEASCQKCHTSSLVFQIYERNFNRSAVEATVIPITYPALSSLTRAFLSLLSAAPYLSTFPSFPTTDNITTENIYIYIEQSRELKRRWSLKPTLFFLGPRGSTMCHRSTDRNL